MGGIETYTVHLAALLQEYDIHTDIYHTGMTDSRHGFHHDYLGKLYQIGRLVVQHGDEYEMVIANSFYGFGYFPPRLKTFNVYHATHEGFAEAIRGIIPDEQYLEWKLLWGGLCESVSGFDRMKIAVSDSVRDELGRFYGFPDVTVVPNCIDTVRFRKTGRAAARRAWGIPDNAFVGLCVGRWDLLKGSDVLEAVMRGMKGVFWVVALGSGSAAPLAEGLTVIEEVPHERMHEVYSAADFLLFPSRYEGFGYTVIEALSCELPVISSDVGIARTVLRQGPFSEFVLPPFSGKLQDIVSAAEEKIEYVRENPGRISEVMREGRMLVEREFGVAAWKDRMKGVLGLS